MRVGTSVQHVCFVELEILSALNKRTVPGMHHRILGRDKPTIRRDMCRRCNTWKYHHRIDCLLEMCTYIAHRS